MKLKTLLLSFSAMVGSLSFAQESDSVNHFEMDAGSVSAMKAVNMDHEFLLNYTMTDKNNGEQVDFQIFSPKPDEFESVKGLKEAGITQYNAVILPAPMYFDDKDALNANDVEYVAVVLNKDARAELNNSDMLEALGNNTIENYNEILNFMRNNTQDIMTGLNKEEAYHLLYQEAFNVSDGNGPVGDTDGGHMIGVVSVAGGPKL